MSRFLHTRSCCIYQPHVIPDPLCIPIDHLHRLSSTNYYCKPFGRSCRQPNTRLDSMIQWRRRKDYGYGCAWFRPRLRWGPVNLTHLRDQDLSVVMLASAAASNNISCPSHPQSISAHRYMCYISDTRYTIGIAVVLWARESTT